MKMMILHNYLSRFSVDKCAAVVVLKYSWCQLHFTEYKRGYKPHTLGGYKRDNEKDEREPKQLRHLGVCE